MDTIYHFFYVHTRFIFVVKFVLQKLEQYSQVIFLLFQNIKKREGTIFIINRYN